MKDMLMVVAIHLAICLTAMAALSFFGGQGYG